MGVQENQWSMSGVPYRDGLSGDLHSGHPIYGSPHRRLCAQSSRRAEAQYDAPTLFLGPLHLILNKRGFEENIWTIPGKKLFRYFGPSSQSYKSDFIHRDPRYCKSEHTSIFVLLFLLMLAACTCWVYLPHLLLDLVRLDQSPRSNSHHIAY